MAEDIITTVRSRRHFLRRAVLAAAAVVAPAALCAGQHAGDATLLSGADTFDEIWRTVRDRFYDPHLRGLDWAAVRERYIRDATRAPSTERLAVVVNQMLSELRASHTRYYTPDEPDYYQLADIFAGALRRRGLEQAFPGGRISYPGIGILSSADVPNQGVISGGSRWYPGAAGRVARRR
jgi:carboxyl-terminal processing protease